MDFNLPFLKEKETEFYYTILNLYSLFFLFSLLILIVVSRISKHNFDNTGMIFMIATSVKMGVAFSCAFTEKVRRNKTSN